MISAAAFAWWWTRDPSSVPRVTADRVGLAVIPPANLGGAASDGWLSWALAEALPQELEPRVDLLVLSSEEVHRGLRDLGISLDARRGVALGGEVDAPPPELPDALARQALAERLGVRWLVVGSYRLEGVGAVRWRLELWRAESGAQKEEEPAALVEETLAPEALPELSVRAAAALATPLESSREAVPELVMAAGLPKQASALRRWAEGAGRFHRGDLEGALGRLEQALQIEPEAYAPLALRARALALRGEQGAALTAAETALAAAPESHRSLWEGRILNLEGKPRKAIEDLLQRARVRGPAIPPDRDVALEALEIALQRGFDDDALRALEVVEAATSESDPQRWLARARVVALAKDGEAQLAAAERALVTADERGAGSWRGWALIQRSQARQRLGLASAARDDATEAQQQLRSAREAAGTARAALTLAEAQRRMDDPRSAEAAYTSALESFRRLGLLADAADALLRRGALRAAQDQDKEAGEDLEAALALLQRLQSPGRLADGYERAARVQLDSGRAGRSEGLLRRSLATRPARDTEARARTLMTLGSVLAVREQFLASETSLREALELAQALSAGPQREGSGEGAEDLSGGVNLELEILQALGGVLHLQGDRQGARRLYGEARELGATDSASLDVQLKLARLDLEEAEMGLGPPPAQVAEAVAGRAETALELLGAEDRDREVEIRLLSAWAQLLAGELAEARQSVSLAQRRASASDARIRFTVDLMDARIAAAEGDRERATRLLERLRRSALVEDWALLALEARLYLGAVELEGDLPQAGRQRLEVLNEESEARGYRRIAQQARALLAG